MQDRFRKFIVPAAAGLLIVPAAALAGVRMLADPDPGSDPTAVGAVTVIDPSPVTATAPAVSTVADDPLAAACGTDAMQLIAQEQAGSLDPIAQAALDALRPICEDAGMPLVAAPTAEPIVVVEQIPVATSATTTRSVGTATTAPPPVTYQEAEYDEGHEYEGEHDEGHEYEGEHDEGHEYEGEHDEGHEYEGEHDDD